MSEISQTMKNVRWSCKEADAYTINELYEGFFLRMVKLRDDSNIGKINRIISSYAWWNDMWKSFSGSYYNERIEDTLYCDNTIHVANLRNFGNKVPICVNTAKSDYFTEYGHWIILICEEGLVKMDIEDIENFRGL